MLKIKDNVKLTRLKEFGFSEKRKWCEYILPFFDCYYDGIHIDKKTRIIDYRADIENVDTDLLMLTIYKLTLAGLVEEIKE